MRKNVLFIIAFLLATACSQPPANSITDKAPAPVVLPDKVTPETKNPFADLAAAGTAGKKHYQANCALCHGDAGKGDGPAAESFTPKPTPLNEGDVLKDPDGEMFLVVKNGKGKMLAAKKLTDEEIWQVVAYVRTLAAK